MSTGLTFGTISALFGLNNGKIDERQYSILVIVVISSAVVPTMIAQWFFQPRVELKITAGEALDELPVSSWDGGGATRWRTERRETPGPARRRRARRCNAVLGPSIPPLSRLCGRGGRVLAPPSADAKTRTYRAP